MIYQSIINELPQINRSRVAQCDLHLSHEINKLMVEKIIGNAGIVNMKLLISGLH